MFRLSHVFLCVEQAEKIIIATAEKIAIFANLDIRTNKDTKKSKIK